MLILEIASYFAYSVANRINTIIDEAVHRMAYGRVMSYDSI